MNLYSEYIKEIEERKGLGLHPKPIDNAELLSEIIAQIKEENSPNRKDCLHFFIYNTLPGTTSAAGKKAYFLKDIILGNEAVSEITPAFALELLSHMKGGTSIEVLLDIALDTNETRQNRGSSQARCTNFSTRFKTKRGLQSVDRLVRVAMQFSTTTLLPCKSCGRFKKTLSVRWRKLRTGIRRQTARIQSSKNSGLPQRQ
jgi:hypothetical protein